jgi:hypothetical protein
VRRAAAALFILTWSSLTSAQPVDEPEVAPADPIDEPPTEPAPAEPGDEPAAGAEDPADAGVEADVEADFGVAPGPVERGDARLDPDRTELSVGGYLIPGFGIRHRPDAVPRDRWELGFLGDAGLVFDAKLLRVFGARVHLFFTSEAFETLTDIELFDLDGDGATDGAVLTRTKFPGSLVEEATVRFQPIEELVALAGVMRIPFTLQQQSPNTALMFSNRSPPNEVFISGADVGVAVQGRLSDGLVTGSFGVFNGDSLGLTFRFLEARGIVMAARADVQPFGDFPFGEGDPTRGPFRLGFGAGAMYRPATLYDETGYGGTTIQDVRVSGSIRMAYSGLYLGVEAMRRQQTDDFTSRPQVANGAYAQGALFLRVSDPVAVEPIIRAGFVVEDDAFAPRTTGWTDAGISVYPRADAAVPDAIRLTVQYLGERRFTEGEDAHGGAATVKLKF